MFFILDTVRDPCRPFVPIALCARTTLCTVGWLHIKQHIDVLSVFAIISKSAHASLLFLFFILEAATAFVKDRFSQLEWLLQGAVSY